jgi:5'-nucleotidase
VQILLTNDDGIYAPGLKALRDALLVLGDVQVVAPASEQSGVGLSITYRHPLMVQEEIRDNVHWGWTVAGRPADCVKLGVLQFCKSRPDLVVSGINSGLNTGIDVLYSGTVAGAIEGAFFGITSVAVSYAIEGLSDYVSTARRAVDVIRQIVEHHPEPGSLWNLNFPANRPGWPVGVKLTSLGVRWASEVMEKRVDPRGRAYYWSDYHPRDKHTMEAGTDVRELAEGYATLTPMHFDLTHRPSLDRFENHGWNLPVEE